MFGFLPWFALFRRMRALRFFVFFDMADQPTWTVALLARRPRQQLVGAPRVDDPLERHAGLGGPVAAVGLPLQLAGGVGVGVDGEQAAVGQGGVEELARRIEPLRAA